MQSAFAPVSWCYRTNIYEVNIRQYTREGTFAAFAGHLPRLQAMGVETLWLMPITPIGMPRRLGTLGSYYACSSYVKINPEFGSLHDFKQLVHEAHRLGMKLIIDWVANHTGYGHEWMMARPDFYVRNEAGEFTERNGWTDVADLDYGNRHMREAMLKAMHFWITECDIDGFRCDMAHLVPLDFWQEARRSCDALKPLFWLAETENAEYHKVFDASYAWEWMHETGRFFKGKQTCTVLDRVLYKYQDHYPVPSWKLFFTTNHDENSWNGTEFEKYGDAAWALFVFSAIWQGIPLIYSGQELPNHKRLRFFDKDEITWHHPMAGESFFGTLLHLRKRNRAAGGPNGHGHTWRLPCNNERAMVFLRRYESDSLLAVLNFSGRPLDFHINDRRLKGAYTEVFLQHQQDFSYHPQVQVEPFGYRLYEQRHP